MSSTVNSLKTPQAPWRSQFEEHLSKMDSPEFVLSTLHPAPPDSTTPYLPRARFCIYRGMWAHLPENKHNNAPRNEPVFDSDLPTFTTDVRMEKPYELFATGPGKGDRSQSGGSGGGGPVEAVWWVKDVGAQWWLKGTAYVVGNDIDGSGDESSGVRTVKSEIGERMRVREGMEGKTGEWRWSKEVTGHFGNCSPGMRGTWRNPPPGTPADEQPDEDHKLGQKVTNLEDKIARSNFRVVIIKPDSVESVDLSDPEKARRRLYTFKSEQSGSGEVVGTWSEEILWP